MTKNKPESFASIGKDLSNNFDKANKTFNIGKKASKKIRKESFGDFGNNVIGKYK